MSGRVRFVLRLRLRCCWQLSQAYGWRKRLHFAYQMWTSCGAAVQYPGVELKTEESKNPVPIPQHLCLELSKNHTKWGSGTLVTNEWGAVSRLTVWRSGFEMRGLG
jgi:hypothetical protein